MEKWGTKMTLENSEHKKTCFGGTGEQSIQSIYLGEQGTDPLGGSLY